MKYLGHILSTTGVRPDPDKIKVLLDWETPRNLKEVQPFHGLGNYVNFARISRPLTNLMKKEAPFAWTLSAKRPLPLSNVTSLMRRCNITSTQSSLLFLLLTLLTARPAPPYINCTPALTKNLSSDPSMTRGFLRSSELLRSGNQSSSPCMTSSRSARTIEPLSTSETLCPTSPLGRILYLSRFNFQIVYKPGYENHTADALSRKDPSVY